MQKRFPGDFCGSGGKGVCVCVHACVRVCVFGGILKVRSVANLNAVFPFTFRGSLPRAGGINISACGKRLNSDLDTVSTSRKVQLSLPASPIRFQSKAPAMFLPKVIL